MPVTCDDLVAFGEGLGTTASETDLRAAISRAYYGAYHHSLIWESQLPELGHEIGPAGGIHQKLLNRLQNPGALCSVDKKLKSRSLSYRLKQLKIERTEADYNLVTKITDASATMSIANARKLLTDFPV